MFLLLFCLSCATFAALGSPVLQSTKGFDETNQGEYLLQKGSYPDAYLTTVELIEKHGYHGEAHHVITEDNYILEVHRIAGRKEEPRIGHKPVVFLMHGLLANSATWVIAGPQKSLSYLLADAGYDVWLGNARGSTYSRKHITLSVTDKEFWPFSWHEIGTRDLPAMIDYVLKKTNQQNLLYIGHSQGTTTFFVMSSQLPEYQKKVKAMFALAPVSYSSRMTSPVFQALAPFVSNIEKLTTMLGKYEFKPTDDCMRKFTSLICGSEAITQPFCRNIFFLLGGFNEEQMNRTLLPSILGHVPAGASVKQFVHYSQLINSGKFRQFDYGLAGNWQKYRKLKPPSYNLGSIKVPVYLHYSTNDWLSHVRDVHQLYNELGNPVMKLRVPDAKFNHLDFIWGIDADKLLYRKILSLISRIESDKNVIG